MKTDVLGVQYDNVTMAEAVARGRELLDGTKPAYCVTPNAEIAYEALHDEAFRAVLNEADLRAAQEKPEEYRGLTVRVAGYTAYFTELARDLQDEIIARTTYESA